MPRYQTFFNIFQTRTLATKLGSFGGRAVGATNRTLPRRNAVERSNLRPFGIKGYFGSNRRNDAANVLRRSTRNSRQVATIAAPLGPARNENFVFFGRERSRRRRSTRTAEPRVERRSNRKSRSRSIAARPDAGFDNKVPRVLREQATRQILPIQRPLPQPLIPSNLLNFSVSPSSLYLPQPLKSIFAKPPISSILNVVATRIDAENLFEKIYSPPFSKSQQRV